MARVPADHTSYLRLNGLRIRVRVHNPGLPLLCFNGVGACVNFPPTPWWAKHGAWA